VIAICIILYNTWVNYEYQCKIKYNVDAQLLGPWIQVYNHVQIWKFLKNVFRVSVRHLFFFLKVGTLKKNLQLIFYKILRFKMTNFYEYLTQNNLQISRTNNIIKFVFNFAHFNESYS